MVKIKGLVVLDTLQAVKAREGQAGWAKLFGLLGDDAKACLQGELHPTAWYPLEVLTELLGADLRETASGKDHVLVGRVEAVVEKELRGVYRALFRPSPPEVMLKRIVTIHETYFQGVTIGFEQPRAGLALITYAGFGEQHEVMKSVLIGFYRKALELCGAKQTGASLQATTVEGTLRWTVTLLWQ